MEPEGDIFQENLENPLDLLGLLMSYTAISHIPPNIFYVFA